jgi:hypothetical protein
MRAEELALEIKCCKSPVCQRIAGLEIQVKALTAIQGFLVRACEGLAGAVGYSLDGPEVPR